MEGISSNEFNSEFLEQQSFTEAHHDFSPESEWSKLRAEHPALATYISKIALREARDDLNERSKLVKFALEVIGAVEIENEASHFVAGN